MYCLIWVLLAAENELCVVPVGSRDGDSTSCCCGGCQLLCQLHHFFVGDAWNTMRLLFSTIHNDKLHLGYTDLAEHLAGQHLALVRNLMAWDALTFQGGKMHSRPSSVLLHRLGCG